MTDAVSLREHLETRIDALDKLVEQRAKGVEDNIKTALAAAREADAKAANATEKRFEGVNEFRAALNDMVGHMMPRAESEANWRNAREKIELMMPRSEADTRWTTSSDRLGTIDTRLTRIEGAGLGVKGSWGVLAGIIGLAIATVSLVLAHSH